jgi:hypothetical protein
MASVIQIKRGLKANLPLTAVAGELLLCLDTGELFYGTGAGIRNVSDKIPNVKAWRSAINYKTGDLILKEGLLYVCTLDHTSVNFLVDESKWDILSSGGSESSVNLQQWTKLDVTAPYENLLTIPTTFNFKRPAIEVLKVSVTADNIITTLCEFNNGDSSSFEPNDNVIFDGNMKLKTSYDYAMTKAVLGVGYMFSAPIDINAFKTIEKIEVI